MINQSPAFPFDELCQGTDDVYEQHRGMTLWDYFFAHSIGSVIEECADHRDITQSPAAVAGWAAGIAEAMMAERAKRHA